MKKSYEKQILDHNVKKFSLIIKADLNMETLTWANKNDKLQVNSLSNLKKILKDLKWHFRKDERQRL